MDNLRAWRKSKDYSQEDLGRKLGLGDQWKTYQSYESGRTPFPESLKKKLRAMHYDGPFPELRNEITRADLETLRNDLRGHQGWVLGEIQKGHSALGALLQEILSRLGPPGEIPPAPPSTTVPRA